MQPLNGVRILDLTRVVSGPFCTMLLGDLGAEVIKIEEPAKGDDSRAFGPPFSGGESAYFLSVNRNKRSCAINLKSSDGVDLIRRLARHSDVIIDNFRPGTTDRLGLDYEALRAENPRLISCSITGFGRTGVDAQRPGYDLIIQGESGIMDITGDPDGPPTKIGTSIADLITGQYASQAIMAALLQRAETGTGHHVDIAMLDCMASLLTFNAGIYFTTGRSPKRRGNAHPTITPYETFQASDGWMNIGVANDKFWRLFCDVIQRPDLAADARYAKAADRVALRDELIPTIAKEIAAKPRGYWAARLQAAGVPYGDIRSVEDVCEAEQLTSRGMVFDMAHPTAGMVRNIDSPFRFDGEKADSHRAPPMLGQHTREVLSQYAGLVDSQLADLEARGVIRIGTIPDKQ